MNIFIYDTSLTLLGVIDDPISLIWTRRYWECGEFKLLIGYSDFNRDMLAMGNIITIQGYDEAGQISYVAITKDEKGEQIEVQGKFLLSWLGKRIIENQIITKSTTELIMLRIVKENAVNPTNSKRKIPNLLLGASQGLGGTIDYSSDAYVNALTALETAAKAGKLGIKIITDFKNKNHTFTVYKGVDRTVDNTDGLPPCIFSPEYDNVLSQDYEYDTSNKKTTAYIGGETKEGEQRVVVSTQDSFTGLDRTEVFVNASDIKQSYMDGTEEISISLDEYKNLLLARGNEELASYTEARTFNSELYTAGNLVYKQDYDVGDRVTCLNKQWGIQINSRITEVQEVYQDGAQSIQIKFGESAPKLLNKIRQINSQKGV